jgi:hypothetical protein
MAADHVARALASAIDPRPPCVGRTQGQIYYSLQPMRCAVCINEILNTPVDKSDHRRKRRGQSVANEITIFEARAGASWQ